jgi:protein gp37
MGENTKIEWCDHTFNPWIGCTKVSPGCAHCYAEALMDTRWGKVKWGPGGQRVRTSAANWKLPLRWNTEAEKKRFVCAVCGQRGTGLGNDPQCAHVASGAPVLVHRRPRVFCASLADWLDDAAPVEWLADLLGVINDTPHLDWLLLTKRPEKWRGRLEGALGTGRCALDMILRWLRGDAPGNVWIGTSVEDQVRADERIPRLLEIPARVRFLSMEPLLGPVDLGRFVWDMEVHSTGYPTGVPPSRRIVRRAIDWVIVGGESGRGARPAHPEWVASLRDQTKAGGAAFMFKQWGTWHPNCLCAGKGHPNLTVRRPQPGLPGVMFRCGKRGEGNRELFGREWNEFPGDRHASTGSSPVGATETESGR